MPPPLQRRRPLETRSLNDSSLEGTDTATAPPLNAQGPGTIRHSNVSCGPLGSDDRTRDSPDSQSHTVDSTDEVYLDYAASPPAPITPVQSFATSLASTLYANPHSASTAGTETALLIAKTRSRVLSDLFNVPVSALDQWDVVFTPGGATRGIQMIGSAWKWRKGSDSDGQIGLSYLRESHTRSVRAL